MSPLAALPVDLLLLAGLVGFGFLLARAILHDQPWVDSLVLSFPLGSGVLTWLIFVSSLVGMSVSLPALLGVGVVATLSVGVYLVLRKKSDPVVPSAPAFKGSSLSVLSQAGLAGSLLLFGLSLFLTIGRAQAGWDAMAIWSAKGYGIALEGSIQAGRHWGEHGLSYPLNIPLLISFFSEADGDVLPGSKLIFPLFYASLIVGCYRFWRRQRVSGSFSSLGLITLGSIPVVYDHATLGYANLPEACYLVLGCLCAVEGSLSKSTGMQLMSGILLGLAVWTRPEGVVLVVLSVLVLSLMLRLVGRAHLRWAIWLLPVLLLGGVWLAFARNYTGSSQFAGILTSVSKRWMRGAFNLSALRMIGVYTVREATDVSVWGLMTPVIIALAWIGRRRLTPKAGPAVLPLLAVGLITGAAVLVFYYLASFGGPPLDWWLSTGLDRTALPSVLLLAVATFLAAGAAPAAETEG